MRLVTFDRGGHRRLGAIFAGEVVDLPDLVGHPAFPPTLEALVSSSRGTILDAGRAALERDDVMAHVVKRARILTPLFPRSLLSPGSSNLTRTLVGPEQEVPWPSGAAWLEYEPKVAAVLGKEVHRAEESAIADHVFGYTLVNDWSARDASGSPMATAAGLPIAIGPVVVTADELEPQSLYLDVLVDGESIAKGNLNGAARSLFALIAAASREGALERGDAFALGPFGPAADPARQLWPGAQVELRAAGIGTLKNRIAPN